MILKYFQIQQLNIIISITQLTKNKIIDQILKVFFFLTCYFVLLFKGYFLFLFILLEKILNEDSTN